MEVLPNGWGPATSRIRRYSHAPPQSTSSAEKRKESPARDRAEDDRPAGKAQQTDGAMSDKLTRIAIVSTDKCKPKKCRQECRKSCPVVRMGGSAAEDGGGRRTC
jgi:hypothetical protein